MAVCIHNNIINSTDVCGFITENCQNKFDFFNFIRLYYCIFDRSIPLLLLVSLAFVLLVFNFLGAISNNYLAPSLETVSKKLKLSEAVSGISLLAFAASAPDVVTGLVAGGRSEGGVRIAIGGLFGACLFTITIVLAGCILGAKTIKAEKKDLGRDIGFLMLSLIYFITLTFVGEITPILVGGFFLLYLCFFFFVIFQEKRKAKAVSKLRDKLLVLDLPGISDEGDQNPATQDNESSKRTHKGELNFSKEVKSQNDADELDLDEISLNFRFRSSWRRKTSQEHSVTVAKHFKRPKIVKSEGLNDPLISLIEEQSEDQVEVVENKPNTFHRILKLMNYPILFLGDLTMLPVEPSRWNLYMVLLVPLFGPLLIIWELGFFDVLDSEWYLWIVFGALASLSVVFLYLMGRNRNLAEIYPGAFGTFTLIISIFWLNLISGLIVDFLTFVQVLTELSVSFLSVTLLAWGNSLEDYFINYTIAKKGYGKTALGGVYGSQIFAIMIGFGGGLFRSALSQPLNLDLYNFESKDGRENLLVLFLLCGTILMLLLTLIIGKLKKWTLGRRMIIFSLIFYFLFVLGAALITFI